VGLAPAVVLLLLCGSADRLIYALMSIFVPVE